jgi:hypothetical protein
VRENEELCDQNMKTNCNTLQHIATHTATHCQSRRHRPKIQTQKHTDTRKIYRQTHRHTNTQALTLRDTQTRIEREREKERGRREK